MSDQEIQKVLVQYGLADETDQGIKHRAIPPSLRKALDMKPDEMYHTSMEVLAECMAVLAEYLLFFQLQYNIKLIDLNRAKSAFQDRLAVETYRISGGTIKERETKAIEQSKDLLELRNQFRGKEASLLLMEGIPDTIREKLNVFKKVYDVRANEQRFSR